MEFYLTKQYHIVEKGLALPNPRPGFGFEKINILLTKGNFYKDKYGCSNLTSAIANCLKSYLDFNAKVNFDLKDNYKTRIERFIIDCKSENPGGVKIISKEEMDEKRQASFSEFVKSRHSVRDFSDVPVSEESIISSIELAKFAPSVCNRQAWKAHVYSDKSKIVKLLEIQNGNGGFTDCVDTLIIVTGDIKGFSKYESNQIFVDGGLFSMNLMLALHHNGLGSCPLNTCFPYIVEKKVKNMAGIPEHERLVMMIAVGNLKDEYRVAISARKSNGELLEFHN
ncbi:Nitroreductase [uncultured Thiomicrorhabdus sp.]